MDLPASLLDLGHLSRLQLNIREKLLANGLQSAVWPPREPVDGAAADEGRKVTNSFSEGAAHWAHSDDDMQIQAASLNEVLLEIFSGAGIVQCLLPRSLGDCSEPLLYLHPVVRWEQVWNGVRVQKVVEVAEHEATTLESRVGDQEGAAATFLAGTHQDALQTFSPLLQRAARAELDLHEGVIAQGRGKLAQRLPASALQTDDERVSLAGHPENSTNAQEVQDGLLEQNDRNGDPRQSVVVLQHVLQILVQGDPLIGSHFIVEAPAGQAVGEQDSLLEEPRSRSLSFFSIGPVENRGRHLHYIVPQFLSRCQAHLLEERSLVLRSRQSIRKHPGHLVHPKPVHFPPIILDLLLLDSHEALDGAVDLSHAEDVVGLAGRRLQLSLGEQENLNQSCH